MIDSIERTVIGLSKYDIINILGYPDSDGVFHAPGMGLAYVISTPSQRLIGMTHEFLIIHLDENLIAVDIFIMQG